MVKLQMKAYSDSLEATTDPEIISSLSGKLSALRPDSLSFSELYDQIRAGKTKIDAIEARGAMNLEQFQDTLIREFAVPIDMQHDTSTFYFYYYGLEDTLQISYQRDIIQNLDGMRMKIKGISVNREISTFDSIRVRCYKSECSNDLTTIYVYF